jgi:hypothetical protein
MRPSCANRFEHRPARWFDKYRVIRPGDLCECGQPATIVRASEKVCARCRNLETQQKGLEHRKEFTGVRATVGQAHEIKERRFEPVVEFQERMLHIVGHGEYKIAV